MANPSSWLGWRAPREILIHLAPHLLGDGVRLFDQFGGPVRLEKISAADGPLATHLRYRC